MEMIDSLAGAENVRHGCQLILDWLVGRKARDERSTNGMMGWLAGVQGRKEITTLPRGQGVAIVQQIKAVEAHHRALRARQSDLIRALETLIRLLERHEPGRNIIHFKAK